MGFVMGILERKLQQFATHSRLDEEPEDELEQLTLRGRQFLRPFGLFVVLQLVTSQTQSRNAFDLAEPLITSSV